MCVDNISLSTRLLHPSHAKISWHSLKIRYYHDICSYKIHVCKHLRYTKKKFFSLEYFCFFCFWNSEIKEKLFSCTRNRFGLGLFYMFPRSCCFCLLCKTLLWHASLILSARKRTETYIYSNFLMFIFSFSSSKTFRLYSKELGK